MIYKIDLPVPPKMEFGDELHMGGQIHVAVKANELVDGLCQMCSLNDVCPVLSLTASNKYWCDGLNDMTSYFKLK